MRARAALLLLALAGACSTTVYETQALCDHDAGAQADATADSTPDSRPDAAVDALVDTAPDAAPRAIDPARPWWRVVVHGPEVSTDGWVGADGMDPGDVDGDGLVDWVSGGEESNYAVLAFGVPPDQVGNGVEWPYIRLPAATTCIGIEDAVIADVDGDGCLDVVLACSAGRKLMVEFSPKPCTPATTRVAANWTHLVVDAATNVEEWLRIRVADIDGDGRVDIVAGGYGVATGAPVGYFTAASPRSGASWSFHQADVAGAIQEMDVYDYDGDGRLDIALSDRDTICQSCGTGQQVYNKRGFRVLLHPVPPSTAWTNVTVIGVGTTGNTLPSKPRWHCSSPDHSVVVEGSASGTSPNVNHLQMWRRDTAGAWSKTDLSPGTGVGWYQSCALGDFRHLGRTDIVLAYSSADPSTGEGDQGVVIMLDNGDGTYTQGQVSGTPGCKFDNTRVADVNGDGWEDIVQSEQGCSGGTTPPAQRLGMLAFINPMGGRQ